MKAEIVFSEEFKSNIRSIVRQTVAEMMPQQQTIQPQIPEYLNLGESAAFLNISRGTLTKLINKGAIKLVPFGRAKRISKKQLIEFMASKEV